MKEIRGENTRRILKLDEASEYADTTLNYLRKKLNKGSNPDINEYPEMLKRVDSALKLINEAAQLEPAVETMPEVHQSEDSTRNIQLFKRHQTCRRPASAGGGPAERPSGLRWSLLVPRGKSENKSPTQRGL